MPRPSNWKSLAPFPPPATSTFQHQSDLKQLPVPQLASTLAKLKESLKPLAHSSEEYRSVIAKIDEFGKSGGLGESLQQRLEQRRSERDHWLEEWWDDGGYLAYRDSVRKTVFICVQNLKNLTIGHRQCILLLWLLSFTSSSIAITADTSLTFNAPRLKI
jgi:hypothetical protein